MGIAFLIHNIAIRPIGIHTGSVVAGAIAFWEDTVHTFGITPEQMDQIKIEN